MWEKSIRDLTTEAINALTNTRAFKPDVQVTYAVFLENLLAEFKPNASEAFEKSIIEKIRDAKIEITKDARKERSLRMMKSPISPSEIAVMILEGAKIEAAKVEASKTEATKKAEPAPLPEFED
jgi:hypothetical protein